MSGAKTALEHLFYEYLLKAFTKKRFPGNEYTTNVTEPSVFTSLPELSGATSTFKIVIEELYDDAMYFDRDPSLFASQYFNLTSASITSYFDSIFNISNPAVISWLYDTGVTQLCSDNPLLWVIDNIISQYKDGIPLSALESQENLILNDFNRVALTQKYLGNEQFILSGGYYIPWIKDVTFNFKQGNNWFYWLSGEFLSEVGVDTIDSIKLSSASLNEVGTGGESYYDSDVLFARRGDSISGAWLRLTNLITAAPVMSAKFIYGNNSFNFPYPGYGVSGEDLDWTGRQLDNLGLEFSYLDTQIQKQITNLYWSTPTQSVSTFTPVYIYDTVLINNGSKAGRKFDVSDQIIVREGSPHDATPDAVYNGEQKYAWLYRFENTDLPIAAGSNKLYWPFIRYTDEISMVALSSQCAPITLSSVNVKETMLGGIAGGGINDSDVIYKLDSPDGVKVEAAWLSGELLSYAGLVSGVSQPGLTFSSPAGEYTTFIWEDSTIRADEVFEHYNHQDDCRYLRENLISLYKDKPNQKKGLDYNQWQKCTCKSIFFSPLGHPGNTFDDYDRMCDFIAVINNPSEFFNLATWVDGSGKTYKTSSEFGWFKLLGSNIEPDVGWGNGAWVTNTNNPFYFTTGKMYIYFRSKLNRNSSADAPYFVKKYKYANNNQRWVKASKNSNNIWVSDGVLSNMVVVPGNYLQYDHKETNYFTITSQGVSSTIVYNASAKNITYTIGVESHWSNYTYVTTGYQIDLQWPLEVYDGCPSLQFSEISAIDWHVTAPYGSFDMFRVSPAQPFSFIASRTGVYFISAIGYRSGFSGTGSFSEIVGPDINYTSIIPPITCVDREPSFAVPTTFDNFTQHSINFSINIPLSGWNYNTNIYDGIAYGARPYWAVATDQGTDITKYKGIDRWGGTVIPIDDYNFISQPEFSDILFSQNTYIEYVRNSNTSFVWTQPLVLSHNIQQKHWCKLLFDTSRVTNLTGILFNNLTDLVITGSNIPSDLVLNIIEDEPLLINYYASNDMTWVQEISNTSLGLPPTGGVWVQIVSGNLITPLTPYAYLTNRHYPTYASAPYVGELYSVAETGGYFIPRMFGASTFVGKRYKNILETSNIPYVENERGYTRIFRNIGDYRSDYGLTRTDQLAPVSTGKVDSSWAKAEITEWTKSGMIVNARDHQEFMPYQTKYETLKYNDNGIRRQGDKYDPWTGEYDNEWENDVDWPPNFRKQYNIEEWYNQFALSGVEIYKWKTDVFGNQYALFKDLKNKTIYQKRQDVGEIWIRDARNIVKPGTDALAQVFDNFTAIDSSLNIDLSSNIRDFDIWFDTMMIYTTGWALFTKLSFDYDNNLIYSIADNIHQIQLEPITKLGGVWFDGNEKTVTICTVVSARVNNQNYYYPVLNNIDLETNRMVTIYNGGSSSNFTSMSSLLLTAIDQPVFTYNLERQLFNVSFTAQASASQGMYLATINIVNSGNNYGIQSFRMLTPVA